MRGFLLVVLIDLLMFTLFAAALVVACVAHL